jgi:hypothetical protein
LSCIEASIEGQRGTTGDTAVRLANFVNTTDDFWMNLQKTYELRLTERDLPSQIKSTSSKAGTRSDEPDAAAWLAPVLLGRNSPCPHFRRGTTIF